MSLTTAIMILGFLIGAIALWGDDRVHEARRRQERRERERKERQP
jgi:hypothetical protein